MTTRSLRNISTAPIPSRSPSQTSASDADAAQEESADDSDFHDVEDDGDLSARLAKMGPAIATPRLSLTATPWPFTSVEQVTSPVLQPRSDLEVPASSLPHEILLHILRLLPASSLAPALRVCKAWCQCGVELLWHKPNLSRLQPLFKMIQTISDPDATFPYPNFVRRLNFSQIAKELDDRMLHSLKPCTRLERLTLAGSVNATSSGLRELLSACENLVALDLSDVPTVNDDVLETIAATSPKLQGLNLGNCKEVTNKGIEAIARNCPSIRRIKLRGLVELTDAPIALLALKCPLLLEIDLIGCFRVTDASLQQLWRTSLNLRELSLHLCTAVSDRGFPSTHALGEEMQGVTNEPLALTDGTTIPVLSPLVLTPRMRLFDHVRYLDLTSLSRLTDAAVAGIVQYMPKIRNLILAKCTGLTDDSVYSICNLGKNLHYLHLGHVSAITDRAVTKLARSCTRLRYIDLACCNLLTDMSVFELAQNLHRLKRIGLVRVNNLTDEAVYALFARTSLERIHLSYCENISVVAINELLNTLHKLTHLSLTGIPAFRRDDLQQWCRLPPADFNPHQRAAFCVYSGKGVSDLRKYLAKLNIEGNPDLNPVVNGVIVELPRPVRGGQQRMDPMAAAAAVAAGAIPHGAVRPGNLVTAPRPGLIEHANGANGQPAGRRRVHIHGQHPRPQEREPREGQRTGGGGNDASHPYSSRQIPIRYVGPPGAAAQPSATSALGSVARSASQNRASAPPELHSPFNYSAAGAASSSSAAAASAGISNSPVSPTNVTGLSANEAAARDTSRVGWTWNAGGDISRRRQHMQLEPERPRTSEGMDVEPLSFGTPASTARDQDHHDDEDEEMDAAGPSARNSDTERRPRRATVTRDNYRHVSSNHDSNGNDQDQDDSMTDEGEEEDLSVES